MTTTTQGGPSETWSVRVYKQYFNFGSAHFLIFGDGSREELHGHNYKVEVEVEGDTIAGDLVLDFIQFKPIVKGICDRLDHRMLLPLKNPNLQVSVLDDRVEARYRDGSFFCFPKKDVHLLDLPNTSTEMLARYIAQQILSELPARIPDARVRALEVSVEESPGQSGVYRLTFG
ncbi:MAG: 6-carboxytetrahydropterin synthase [Deltaproteobacteria bacterium]|nr:6-carboxytetrahydropterin synthase [Deltaproteobacteria bacterium]